MARSVMDGSADLRPGALGLHVYPRMRVLSHFMLPPDSASFPEKPAMGSGARQRTMARPFGGDRQCLNLMVVCHFSSSSFLAAT